MNKRNVDQIIVGVVVAIITWWLLRGKAQAAPAAKDSFEFSESWEIKVPCKIGEPGCKPAASPAPVEDIWKL